MCHFSTGKIYISTQSSANEQKYLWPTRGNVENTNRRTFRMYTITLS